MSDIVERARELGKEFRESDSSLHVELCTLLAELADRVEGKPPCQGNDLKHVTPEGLAVLELAQARCEAEAAWELNPCRETSEKDNIAHDAWQAANNAITGKES